MLTLFTLKINRHSTNGIDMQIAMAVSASTGPIAEQRALDHCRAHNPAANDYTVEHRMPICPVRQHVCKELAIFN
jgi:hypothetical protein